MFMRRVFLFSALLMFLAWILLSLVVSGLLQLLGYASAIAVASFAILLLPLFAVIYIVAKRRLRIGRSRHPLLKYQDILDAAIFFPGTLLFFVGWSLLMGLVGVGDRASFNLGVSILQIGLCLAALYGARFVLRYALFSSDERAELDTKSKTRLAVVRAARRGARRSMLGSLVGPGWR